MIEKTRKKYFFCKIHSEIWASLISTCGIFTNKQHPKKVPASMTSCTHAMPPGGLLMNQPVDISVSLSAGSMRRILAVSHGHQTDEKQHFYTDITQELCDGHQSPSLVTSPWTARACPLSDRVRNKT
ncbi:hypothetical protein NP493_311g02087 [Ridgeia piscesae]|uniref:Uncharacterized protein n=1 Tax=Ridgeia piscesae TaxID=27915 RepID=A0AAD9NUZ7_RIDPI|nr:hypothetical protein NP493_311g02087 [Ridgeia piscesae]